jgi:hemerythrin-like domain-containing protein
MGDITEPLREEHKQLAPEIERLRIAADSVGEGTLERLRREIDKIQDFLTHRLLPHALAEEEVLYVTVGTFYGTLQATATMSRDHAEISRLTEQLRRLRSDLMGSSLDTEKANELRLVLYSLYALVKAHLAKEEEVYFPLLDARLSEEEAHQLFHKMAAVAHGASGHPEH